MSSSTVVIPALNEQGLIAAAVASVISEAREVIVVDGDSNDATRTEARAAGAQVMVANRGRAAQMDAGALEARGEWLVFLHADTRLGRGWAAALDALPSDVVGGAFAFALESRRPRYRLVEAAVALRCALLRLPYGDQSIFVRRHVFRDVGGYRPTPILEDVDLVRRLRRRGRLAFPPVPALTSPRRWEERGFLATTLRNWSIMLLDAAGVSRERLARL